MIVNDGKITAAGRGIHLFDGVVTINGGEIVAKTLYAVWADGSSKDAKLTITNGKVIALAANKYALGLWNKNATYAISGGTFESRGAEDMAAIELGTGLLETKDGKTNVVEAVKGILSGGRYLNVILANIADGRGATVNLTSALVAEGATVTEDGNYKVINAKTDDQQNTGDGEQTTPGDTANPDVPNVPKTNDNILVYASLGVVSALTVGFSAKRKENN